MRSAQLCWEQFCSSGANPILALTHHFFLGGGTLKQWHKAHKAELNNAQEAFSDITTRRGKNVDFPVLPGFGAWSVWIHTTTLQLGLDGTMEKWEAVKYTNSGPSWVTSIDEALSLKCYKSQHDSGGCLKGYKISLWSDLRVCCYSSFNHLSNYLKKNTRTLCGFIKTVKHFLISWLLLWSNNDIEQDKFKKRKGLFGYWDDFLPYQSVLEVTKTNPAPATTAPHICFDIFTHWRDSSLMTNVWSLWMSGNSLGCSPSCRNMQRLIRRVL